MAGGDGYNESLSAYLHWYSRRERWKRNPLGASIRDYWVGATVSWITSAFAVAFGGWLFLPFDPPTFSIPLFVGLRVLPQWWWGIACCASGVACVVAVVRGWHTLRLFSSTLKVFLFGTMALAFGAASEWTSTGVPIYGLLAALSILGLFLAQSDE